jgi:hypothetical protein
LKRSFAILEDETPIKVGQTRVYYGKGDYRKPCKIEQVEANKVIISIENKLYTMPIYTIGELIK